MSGDKPRRIIYPPIWLVLGVVSIFVLNEFFPGYRFASETWQMVGGAVLFLGLLVLVWAGGLFKKSEVDLVPFKNVATLVNTGVYRFSRNPMYLGMALLLLGCAITVGAANAFFVVPVFMLIIQFRFILPEERMLLDLFPEEYPAYCRRVRRWV